VRILDPESATRAATRVMIEFRDVETGKKWTTVSVDRNIISASLNALVDGFEYALRETVAACVVDFE
jgi:2-isopropylmalate synthase